MRLDEWRALLDVDDAKSGAHRDEFWAVCPCHNDHEASLHATIGEDGGIRFKCFVCGAGSIDVAKAMGKQAADVMCDALTGEDLRAGSPQGKRKREPKKIYPSGKWEVGKTTRMIGKKGAEVPYLLKAVYDFTDREGRVVMQKARYEHIREDGKKDKYFSFRSIGTDGKWYATPGIYGDLLYGLHELTEAKKTGQTVYIVEGEKDALNLRKLGYCAVSSAYGGGKGKDMSGKWRPDYTHQLRGSGTVIVIPDNDAAGERLAQWICEKIRDVVREVRILRLADSLSDEERARFAKGDFTDWANLRRESGQGRKTVCAEFDALSAAAPVWTKDNVRRFENDEAPRRQSLSAHMEARGTPISEEGGEAGEAGEEGEPYYGLKSYSVKWQRLCRVDPKYGAQILADFVPTPQETITKDDGSGMMETEYVIGGTYGEQELPPARVRSEEFEAMRWPSVWWQFRGNIRPSKGARDYVRDAIMRAGQKASAHRTIYTHTGMRLVDGKPCYLTGGGALGAEGVDVELENNLKYYTMQTSADARDGAQALMRLILCMPAHVILPLLAQAFLAPLYSAMEAMEEPPSYVVYLVGRSGSFKSTIVGYVESMFGHFYMRRHTATFQDTAAAIRDKVFFAKDSLFVVDDYNPETSAARRASMDAVAQAVITAIADRAERGAMTAERRLRGERPARCTCIMTGEVLPNLNSGRILRLYIIDIAPQEIARSVSELNTFRDDALAGKYRAVMRHYIESLLARWHDLPGELRRRMDEARAIVYADAATPKRHARMLDAGTHLLTGCTMLIDTLIELGEIEPDMRGQWLTSCWAAILKNTIAQGNTIDENSPTRVYIEAIRTLVRMGRVRIEPLNKIPTGTDYMGSVMVGYKDDDFYYFDPGAIDSAVDMHLRDRSEELAVKAATVRRMMLEEQLIWGDGDSPTRTKSVQGKTRRLLWIPRATIDGRPDKPEPEPAFERMDGEQEKMPF